MHGRISTYISSIRTWLVVAILALSMQPAVADTANDIPADSLEWFQGASVSYDLVGLGQLMFSDYGHHELALRVNLKDRYFPVLEAGIGRAEHDDDVTGIHYDTSAPYFRIGCDLNMMKQKHSDHKVFLGLRYAYTSFKANISCPQLTDPVWGASANYDVRDSKCNQHWAELVFGVDTKVWGPVRLGWSARYKLRLAKNEGETGKVWYVPGFGTSNNNRITATFNLGLQLDRDLWKKVFGKK